MYCYVVVHILADACKSNINTYQIMIATLFIYFNTLRSEPKMKPCKSCEGWKDRPWSESPSIIGTGVCCKDTHLPMTWSEYDPLWWYSLPITSIVYKVSCLWSPEHFYIPEGLGICIDENWKQAQLHLMSSSFSMIYPSPFHNTHQ